MKIKITMPDGKWGEVDLSKETYDGTLDTGEFARALINLKTEFKIENGQG